MTDNFVFEIMDKFKESNVVELDFTRGDAHLALKKKEACVPAAPMAAPAPQAPSASTNAPQPASSGSCGTGTTEPSPSQDATASRNAAEDRTAAEETVSGETITCPIVGTFYRSPSPDSPAYAEKGARIKKGEPLCIIEAMKMMNTLTADFDLEVVDVLIENAALAEYGQPLFSVIRL